jgi:acyl-CoA synthetase (AMP-forming)/AMP-acid ligase II
MNIATVLRAHADEMPDTPAIIDVHRGQDRTITFAELERQVGQAAALLWEAGLRPGDAVLVFQPMSAELYVALIALFRLGLVAMFVDPSSGMAHVEQCCALNPPRAFIGSPKAHLLRLASPALRRIPRKFVIGGALPGAVSWTRASSLAPREEVRDAGPEAPALLTFTSGSTGTPKAALRSHGFLLAQHRVLAHSFPAAPGCVSLTTLPIFVLADLASGVTSLIAAGDLRHPGRIDAAPVIGQIARHRPLRVGASPAFWERIVAYCRAHNVTLPQLRFVYAGGAPVFPRLLDALAAVAPAAQAVAVYGSTEAEPIAHITRAEIADDDVPAMLGGKGLLAGKPVPEIELRILRDAWGTSVAPLSAAELRARCLPADEPGEIVVSGAHVLPGYVGGRGDEESKFRVDDTVWHRTGDAGYVDAAGRLWLLGRCVAKVHDAHGTLYPFAVECAASAHPVVHRSALVARGGRRALAVELEPGADPAALCVLQSDLAWAELDAVLPLRQIPVDRRHNAKVDYPALYRLLGTA